MGNNHEGFGLTSFTAFNKGEKERIGFLG